MSMELTNIDDIRELLHRHGFRFSRSLGQNFLTARWVTEGIAEGALLDRDSCVLEVGPGIGSLTEEISRRAGKVVSVELDKALRPVLKETLAGRDNVELVFGDVLRLDLEQLVRERFDGLRPVVCANLPYNVTTPLLTAFTKAGCFDTITVMVQREVARRVSAPANTADYGAFAIFLQWNMQVETLFDVPPSCFIPQPKVMSSVIRLTRRAAPPVPVNDSALMFALVRAAFNQRRKTLVNAMCAGLGNIDREQAEAALRSCGFDTKIRGEALDIGGFAKISDEIGRVMNTDL